MQKMKDFKPGKEIEGLVIQKRSEPGVAVRLSYKGVKYFRVNKKLTISRALGDSFAGQKQKYIVDVYRCEKYRKCSCKCRIFQRLKDSLWLVENIQDKATHDELEKKKMQRMLQKNGKLKTKKRASRSSIKRDQSGMVFNGKKQEIHVEVRMKIEDNNLSTILQQRIAQEIRILDEHGFSNQTRLGDHQITWKQVAVSPLFKNNNFGGEGNTQFKKFYYVDGIEFKDLRDHQNKKIRQWKFFNAKTQMVDDVNGQIMCPSSSLLPSLKLFVKTGVVVYVTVTPINQNMFTDGKPTQFHFNFCCDLFKIDNQPTKQGMTTIQPTGFNNRIKGARNIGYIFGRSNSFFNQQLFNSAISNSFIVGCFPSTGPTIGGDTISIYVANLPIFLPQFKPNEVSFGSSSTHKIFDVSVLAEDELQRLKYHHAGILGDLLKLSMRRDVIISVVILKVPRFDPRKKISEPNIYCDVSINSVVGKKKFMYQAITAGSNYNSISNLTFSSGSGIDNRMSMSNRLSGMSNNSRLSGLSNPGGVRSSFSESLTHNRSNDMDEFFSDLPKDFRPNSDHHPKLGLGYSNDFFYNQPPVFREEPNIRPLSSESIRETTEVKRIPSLTKALSDIDMEL